MRADEQVHGSISAQHLRNIGVADAQAAPEKDSPNSNAHASDWWPPHPVQPKLSADVFEFVFKEVHQAAQSFRSNAHQHPQRGGH